MRKVEWRNDRRKVKDLIPWAGNPRKISPENLGQLKASIERFGYAAPVVINADYTIVAGHMRTRAMMELGMGDTEVDVRIASRQLNEEELSELAIRDNANRGDWDVEKMLEMDLELLKKIGLSDQILNKISRMTAIEKAEQVPDPPLEAKAKPGEIYRLGAHRVMCGSATDPDDMAKLMAGETAQVVVTDPPYNINYSGRGKNTSNKIEGDNQTEAAFREFLEKIFKNLARHTDERAAMYCCYASRTHREFEDALNAAGWEVRNQIIWVKTVASMGWGNYRWKHEPIFYCHKDGQGTDFYGDRTNYTEWKEELDDEALLQKFKEIIQKDETEGQTTVWRVKREVDYKHPTQKPVQLIKIALSNSSRPGEIVLDACGGSGSTLMAAELISRRAYLMEIDPRYVDVEIERWENLTGKKAERID